MDKPPSGVYYDEQKEGWMIHPPRQARFVVELDGAPTERGNGPTSTFRWSGAIEEMKFMRIDDKIAVVIPARGFAGIE